MLAPDRSVTVALGGGGAKGFVHVGVLEALCEEGYYIKSIVGTSIGAFIGAMFAYERCITCSNKDILKAQRQAIEIIRDFWLHTNLAQYVQRRLGSLVFRGHLGNTKDLEILIRDQLLSTDHNVSEGLRFDQLDFDLTITAVDVLTGDEIILNRKSAPNTEISKAVRASISLPGAFREASIEIDGTRRHCWDGGLAGNCRLDLACKDDQPHLIVASTLTYRGEPLFETRRVRKLYHIFEQTTNIFLKSLDEHLLRAMSRHHPTTTLCLVKPDLDGVSTYDFDISANKRQILFRNGALATKEALRRCVSGRD